jgi:hypothetical protein
MTVKVNQIVKHKRNNRYFVIINFEDTVYRYVNIRDLNTKDILTVACGTIQANYEMINED